MTRKRKSFGAGVTCISYPARKYEQPHSYQSELKQYSAAKLATHQDIDGPIGQRQQR